MGFVMRFALRSVAVAAALVGAGAAQAAVDVSAITASGTDVAAVGVAVFAVIVGTKLFKWIRRAL